MIVNVYYRDEETGSVRAGRPYSYRCSIPNAHVGMEVIVPILTELNSNCPIIRYLKYVKVMQCIKKLRILCGYGVMRICIIQHHFSIAISPPQPNAKHAL